jgi:hypothetical protein
VLILLRPLLLGDEEAIVDALALMLPREGSDTSSDSEVWAERFL